MPVTIPTQFKLTEAERARLDELGRLLGSPEQPLPMSGVVRLAINRLWEAEARKQTKLAKSK